MLSLIFVQLLVTANVNHHGCGTWFGCRSLSFSFCSFLAICYTDLTTLVLTSIDNDCIFNFQYLDMNYIRIFHALSCTIILDFITSFQNCIFILSVVRHGVIFIHPQFQASFVMKIKIWWNKTIARKFLRRRIRRREAWWNLCELEFRWLGGAKRTRRADDRLRRTSRFRKRLGRIVSARHVPRG